MKKAVEKVLRYIASIVILALVSFVMSCMEHDMYHVPKPAKKIASTTSSDTTIFRVQLSVTAPVKNEAPSDARSDGSAPYTVSSTSWSPLDAQFQGGVAYTITVTLAANDNYTFTGLRSATIDSGNMTVSNNTGTTVTLSFTFPTTDTRTVTDIIIKSQPTKLFYRHGDALDLTGLEVTLKYENSTTEDVLPADFLSNGLTATPAHGDDLQHLAHNGNPIEIKHGNSLASRYTDVLTVEPRDLMGWLAEQSGGDMNNPITINSTIYNVQLTEGNWEYILESLAASPGKYVRLDLSDYTQSDDSTTNGGLRPDGTFDPLAGTDTGKSQIVSLTLPDAATSIVEGTGISSSAFNNFTNLKTVYGKNIETIGNYAFTARSTLTTANFPSATSIGQYAFNNTQLASVSITDATTTTIGNYAFNGCAYLESVDIPNATSIGNYAFENCFSMTSINISAVTSIGTQVFSGTGSTDLTITMGPNAPTVGISNFSGITNKTVTVRIPDDATGYGKNIEWWDNSSNNWINAFRGKGWNETGYLTGTVNADVTVIIEEAWISTIKDHLTNSLEGTDTTNAITITLSTEQLPELTPDSWQLLLETLGALNPPKFVALDFSGRNETTLNLHPYEPNWDIQNCKENIVSITLPEGLTSIGQYVFQSCKNLTTINLPNSITSIGESAFAGCESLTLTELPNSITSIGQDAFAGCENLVTIRLPDSLISIDRGAFYECTNLMEVGLPNNNSITSIEGYAFANCENLTTINLPNSINSIGENAFASCRSLEEIILPNGLTSISDNAFDNCESLTTIYLPDGITSIGSSAFHNCKDLTLSSLPASLTSIGDNAFASCRSLEEISLPENLSSIGSSAFYYCTSLEQLILPASLTSIGTWAFSNCTNLTDVTILSPFPPPNPPPPAITIGEGAFQYCTSLATLTLYSTTPPTLSGAKETTFGYTSLVKIRIPSGSLSTTYTAAGWSSSYTYEQFDPAQEP